MTEDNAPPVDLTNTLNKSDEDIAGPSPADELSMLKDRARLMGISFGGNIGVDALKKKINDRLNGSAEEEQAPAQAAPQAVRAKTKMELEQEIRDTQYAEQMALVRCRIYNLNPAKADIPGEFITVANRYIGTVRKYIPFGEQTEGGYHIPRIIYNDLKGRMFQQIRTKKGPKGQIEVSQRMVPEYNIVELPALTEEELKELALNQAAAQRVIGE